MATLEEKGYKIGYPQKTGLYAVKTPVFDIFNKAVKIVNNKFKLRYPMSIDIDIGMSWAECH